MRFLVDESTGPSVSRWLKSEGHEVFSVFEQARGISDDVILRKADTENWILITNDKDFGEKVFRERLPHKGVVLLRLDDERAVVKIESLQQLLKNHSGSLAENFVVVTEKRIRFARS